MAQPFAPKPIKSIGLPILGVTADGNGVVEYPGDGMLLTSCVTGGGKGRCVILPNLLVHPGSAFVLDFKDGENAKLTGRWRNEGPLKQPVYVLDPFRLVPDRDLPASGRARFDPIYYVANSTAKPTTALELADAFIIPGDKDTHWAEAAKLILAFTILFVATSPEMDHPAVVRLCGERRRTMRTVWRIITDARYRDLQFAMVESADPNISAQGSVLSGMRLVDECVKDEATGKPVWRRVFDKVLNGKENEGKLSTLMTQCLGTFAEDGILDCLEGPSSLDFGSLSRVPSTVYLVLPAKFMRIHARFMRLITTCALSQITDAGLVYPGPDGKRPPATMFYLDEFPVLGRFRIVVDAMALMRGYGVKFWTFVQNLAQLKQIYGESWTEIPGNCGVIQYFGGTNDEITANAISKWSGEQTATKKGHSSSTAPNSGFSTNDNLYGRPVLFPGQVRSIPYGEQINLFLGAKGPHESRMMYRDNAAMFPAFNRWNASPGRRVPVYVTPSKPPPLRDPPRRAAPSEPAPAGSAVAGPAPGERMVIYCPRDGKALRVPTDRGTIKVKCPCGHSWPWSPPTMLRAAE